jgi:hypothetical protein
MQYETRTRRGETQKYNRDMSYRFILKPGMDILISSSIDICHNFRELQDVTDTLGCLAMLIDVRQALIQTDGYMRRTSAHRSTKSISLDRRLGH